MLNTEECLNDIRTMLSMEYDFVNAISFYTGFQLKYAQYGIGDFNCGIEINKKCFICLFDRGFNIDFAGDKYGSRPLVFEFRFGYWNYKKIKITTLSRSGPNERINRDIDVAAAFETLSDSQKLFYLKNLDIFKTQ